MRTETSGEGEGPIRKPETWHDTDRTGMREFRTTRISAHTATAALMRSQHPRSAQKVQAGPNPTGSRKSQGACRIASDRAPRLPAVAFMPQRTLPVKRPKRSPLLAYSGNRSAEMKAADNRAPEQQIGGQKAQPGVIFAPRDNDAVAGRLLKLEPVVTGLYRLFHAVALDGHETLILLPQDHVRTAPLAAR